MKKESKTKKQVAPFDWSKSFKKVSTRNSIKKFLEVTLCLDSSCLEDKMTDSIFCAMLVTYLPNVAKFLPPDIKIKEEEVKACEFLGGLLKSDKDSGWTHPNPEIATALIALMSKGVIAIDFQYSGGWDETSWDQNAPDVKYANGVKVSVDWAKAEEENIKLFEWLHEQTGVNAIDIMYAYLDDSGAGSGNSYSQCIEIRLDKWDTKLYGYEEEEEEDEEDEKS